MVTVAEIVDSLTRIDGYYAYVRDLVFLWSFIILGLTAMMLLTAMGELHPDFDDVLMAELVDAFSLWATMVIITLVWLGVIIVADVVRVVRSRGGER